MSQLLYHGTLAKHVPAIMRDGVALGEGWGGAGTSGAFLSGSLSGACYWAKMAYLRDREEKMEVATFDRKYGARQDKLLAVLVVEIPDSALGSLMADEEQFEDVGAELEPGDWRGSLREIGDVRFDGPVPASWIRGLVLPSGIEANR